MKRKNVFKNVVCLLGLAFVVMALTACGVGDDDWDTAEADVAFDDGDNGADAPEAEFDDWDDEDWDEDEGYDDLAMAAVVDDDDSDDVEVRARAERRVLTEEEEVAEVGTIEAVPLRLPSESGRQLIYAVEFNIDTFEFSRAFRMLLDATGELGGFSERVTEHGRSLRNPDMERHADFALRIPNENLSAFITFIDDNRDVFNRIYTDIVLEADLTFEYERNVSAIETLREDEERILNELDNDEDEESDVTRDDLADVRERIRDLEEANITTQHDVDYSNVSIRLSEVIPSEVEEPEEPEEPETFGDRLQSTVETSLGGLLSMFQVLLFVIIIILPWLVIVALFVAPVVYLIRRYRRNQPDDHNVPDNSNNPDDPNGSYNPLINDKRS